MDYLLKFCFVFLAIQVASGDKCEVFLKGLRKNEIASAVTEIVKVSYKNFLNVHVMYSFGKSSLIDDMARIVSSVTSNSMVTMENLDKNFVNKKNSVKANAAIIGINSIAEFSSMIEGLTNIERSGRHLIVFPNAKHEDLETIFASLWEINLVNVGVVAERNNSIELITFLPFGDQNCGDTSPKKLNSFDKSSKTWNSSTFFPKKLKNLNNCTLRIGSFITIPVTMQKDGRIYGSEADMINNIGKLMNYYPSYTLYSVGSGVVHDNGTGTHLMKTLMDDKVDLIHGFLSLQHSRAKFFSHTRAFAQVPLAIIVPPGALVTPFDKIFYPFTGDIWYTLIAMYVIVFFIIAVLDKYSKTSYNFLIGENIKNPYLSMIIVCLGHTQHKLPNRNFSRFTLMNFMIFWLVVRTCYQGVLFNLLKKVIATESFRLVDCHLY